MLDLSNFGNNLVAEVNYMFSDCTSLIQVDLGNFYSENINDVSHMFDGCESLTNLNLNKFDMRKVENCEDVFNGIPEHGSIIYNDTFSDELIKLVPGAWEKILLKT